MVRVVKQLGFSVVIVALVAAPAFGQDKKLTVGELINHHLDSIGSAQARSFPKNRVVAGPVKLVSRVGTAGNIEGQAAVASSGAKLRSA